MKGIETDYMDAARNCDVLKDGQPVNAAKECQRLITKLKKISELTRTVVHLAPSTEKAIWWSDVKSIIEEE